MAGPNYHALLTPETWHRSYSDIVDLVRAADTADPVLSNHPVRGRIVAVLTGRVLRWELNERLGDGSVTFALLEEDVLLSLMNFRLNKPVSVNVHRDSYFSLAAILTGVDNLSDTIKTADDEPRNLAVFSAVSDRSHECLHYPANRWIQAAAIQMHPLATASILGVDLSPIQSELFQGTDSLNDNSSHYSFVNANEYVKQCVVEICSANYGERLLWDFYSAKARELVCHILGSFVQSERRKDSPYRYSITDRRALEFAKKLLLSDIRESRTISSLAIQAGLSENKLTYGFNYFFGESVHRFVTGHRMRKAYQLLKQTDLSITEVADQVGYHSSSGFIKAFKKEYGTTPLKVREIRTLS